MWNMCWTIIFYVIYARDPLHVSCSVLVETRQGVRDVALGSEWKQTCWNMKRTSSKNLIVYRLCVAVSVTTPASWHEEQTCPDLSIHVQNSHFEFLLCFFFAIFNVLKLTFAFYFSTLILLTALTLAIYQYRPTILHCNGQLPHLKLISEEEHWRTLAAQGIITMGNMNSWTSSQNFLHWQ